MSDQDKSTLLQQINDAIQNSPLKGRALKDVLRDAVRANWPDLPAWSRLSNGPLIEEVQKAAMASGVCVVFRDDDDKLKVVLGQAGTHYQKKDRQTGALLPLEESYTIPGGFGILDYTQGSTLVPASPAPESGPVAAAREVEEEFILPDGSPLLVVDPSRLKPMDMISLGLPNGDRNVILGMMLELNRDEVAAVKAHVARLATDPAYKAAVAAKTENEATGLPEIADVKIFDLDEVCAGRVNLLHKDQLSLFARVKAHYDFIEAAVSARLAAFGSPQP